MISSKSLLRNLIFASCCICYSIAFADVTTDVSRVADVYQVDVLVFEHTDSKRYDAENWPSFVGQLNTKNAFDLDDLKTKAPESVDTLETLNDLDESVPESTSKVIKDSISLVTPSNMFLKQEEHTIKNNKGERFIKHVAWLQPLAMNVRSTPIYFAAGKAHEVQSVISIKPARNVLNVSVDVIYKVQANEIRLTRDVKIKKKEVYYLDHPIIGMFIVITPVVNGN